MEQIKDENTPESTLSKPLIDINIKEKKESPAEFEFEIEVLESSLKPYLDKATKHYAKRLKLPGFRKGKVPVQVVEQHVSKEELLSFAIEDVAPDAIEEILRQNEEIELSATPKIDVVSKNPLTLKATIPDMPKVEIGDYNSIALVPIDVEVNEGEVEKNIEEIRASRAGWERVDQPLGMDDLATLSIKGSVDEDTFIDQKKREVWVSKENKYPLPGFYQQLEGMKRGERRHFSLTIPEGHEPQKYLGRNAHFEVVLHSTKKRNLPELDDAFAKSFNDPEITSIDGLKKRIESNLITRMENDAKKRLEEEFLGKLTEESTFLISSLSIERKVEDQKKSLSTQLSKHKVTLEEQLARENTTLEDFLVRLKEDATKNLKHELLIDELTKEIDPEVDEKEVEKRLLMLKKEAKGRRDIDWDLVQKNVKKSIANEVALKEVIDNLLKNAESTLIE